MTLFAHARELFHVYKIDTSLKLFKLRQISVISHIKLSGHEATLLHSKWVAFQTTSYMLLAMPRVETRGSENEEESKQRC